MGPCPLMFRFGLMVEMSENFKSFLNLTRDLAGSSRNTRQSLASSHLCRLVAAICGHAGDGEYLEQSVPPPHPGALSACRQHRSPAGAGSTAPLAGRRTATCTIVFTTSVGAAKVEVMK